MTEIPPSPDVPRLFPPLRQLLDRYGIRPDKRYGQHFLHNMERLARIAATGGITPQHHLVEIGAGLGNLSVHLAENAASVVAVEADRTFEDWHRYLCALHPKLRIVYGDFLKQDLAELLKDGIAAGASIGAVGNIPYQISSGILFSLVDSELTFDPIVLLVQEEFADRISAPAGTRGVGALTLKVALRYTVRRAFRVPPNDFIPPPKVDSAVVELHPLPAPFFRDGAHRARLYRLLDGAFGYRRKTLANALVLSGIRKARGDAEEALRRAGVDPMRRAETLTIPEVIALEEQLP